MSAPTALVWDPALPEYNFGPAHPMAPARLTLARELMDHFGLLDHVHELCAPVATDAQLARVHEADYINALRRASHTPPDLTAEEAKRYGLDGEDCPPFPGMHQAAARLAGGTVRAAHFVLQGTSPRRAFNFSGGMHHAMPAKAAGFCLYNDAAVAIAEMLARGVRSVVYIDIDAHHGDGVEMMFRDDPRVTTISLHQHPSTLFPHTGLPTDIGGSNARGHALNCALPPGCDDAAMLRALEAIAEPVLEHLEPDVVLTQHGCDGHHLDPLTDLGWTVDGMQRATMLLADLIDAHTTGRWVALGGGGYAVGQVPARAWTHVLAVMAGRPIDSTTPLPASWRSQAATLSGRDIANIPTTMGDGGKCDFKPYSHGYNPADPIDQAIRATRKAAFPDLGIDPMLI